MDVTQSKHQMNLAEEWRPIGGFEGLYEVSDLGRVRSLPRTVRNRYSTALRGGKVLSPCSDLGGYQFVMLSVPNPNKVFCKKIHRLVATAFLGPAPPDRSVVNHKDFDRANNAASNLEWCDTTDNIRHSVDAGRFTGSVSPRRGKKLDTAQASSIKSKHASGATTSDLAIEFSIHPRNVRRILAGEIWRHA